MAERKELGKIAHANFGFGGYQDAMIGLSLTFEGQGWGVGTFHGAWGIVRSDYARWTEAERLTQLGEACMKLRDLLTAAKVQTVKNLVGVPVEVVFEGIALSSYRILTEVL